MTARAALRSVVEERGWRSGTDLEDRAALLLSRMGVRADEVAQQHKVGPYRIDFAFPAPRIALELDGFRHIHDPATARKDAERDAYLREHGWVVLRVHETQFPDTFADMLCRVIQIVRAAR